MKMSTIPEIPTFIVFGRPGSGKTTVATAAVQILKRDQPWLQCLALDLDVCVPQWMRENFAIGIYPNLQERQAFALVACDYVDERFNEANIRLDKTTTSARTSDWISIISFSFVNNDLRTMFRSRFPSATWILIETDDNEAAERIRQRQGHFYKSKTLDADEQHETTASFESDNNDWSFAPVDYPHVVLDGTDQIETNALQIVRLIETRVMMCTSEGGRL